MDLSIEIENPIILIIIKLVFFSMTSYPKPILTATGHINKLIFISFFFSDYVLYAIDVKNSIINLILSNLFFPYTCEVRNGGKSLKG